MCLVIQVPRRDELHKHLLANNIRAAIHYPIPIHLQPVAAYLEHVKGDFPMTEKQADSIMTIPVHQFLQEDDIAHVSGIINSFYE